MKYSFTRMDRLAALRIVAIYALFATLWIYFSDNALAILVQDPRLIVRLGIFKGFFFILVTGALLYQLITGHIKKHRKMEKELRENQNLINTLMEETTDAIFVKDWQGRYLMFNAATSKITGKTQEEAIGHDDTLLLSAEDAKAVMKGDRHVMATGQVLTYEETITVADGTNRTFLVTKGPIFDVAGKVRGLFGIARDITVRKLAEEAIKESEEKFRLIVENTTDVIAIFDKDIRYKYINPACRLYFSLNPEDFIGKTHKELGLSEEKARLWDDCLKEVFETSKAINQESEVDGISGKIFFDWRVFPEFDPTGKVKAVVTVSRDITERKKSEELIKNILESVDEGFIIINRDFQIITANRAYAEKARIPMEGIIGHHCYEISHHSPQPCYESGHVCAVKQVFDTGEAHTVVHKHRDSKGNFLYMETKAYPLDRDESGKVTKVIEILIDITEKKRLEEQFHQAQKMEAIGKLASGVAHDFNNILTAIIGYSHVTLMKMPAEDPLRVNIEHMLEAADRATQLTHGLLAFSRKQIIDRKPVDLNDLVRRVEKFLKRVIGEDVEIKIIMNETAVNVLADAGQLEQVFMNLATNARDAMPHGGYLTIETALTELDQGFIMAHGHGTPGKFAMITTSDTGMGMDEETRLRIFEPFFTTKEVGKGTGLGMSVVYGIINQHDGFINVYSEPGLGTIIRIYLPAISTDVPLEKKEALVERPRRGTETVLLAEDDVTLRELSKVILEEFGYKVIEARDGEEAVVKFREHLTEIDLLVFDFIMPKKNGWEAYDEIRKIRPGIKAIFQSGYAPEIVRQKALMEKDMVILYKPLSPSALLKKIREVLGN